MKQRSGVRATAQTDSGLGFVQLGGELTAPALCSALTITRDWMNRTGLPALVADYSEAAIAVSTDDLRRSVLTVARLDDCGLLRPTALVVVPWQLRMLQDYCAIMREHGVSRAAFTSVDAAQAWAAEQAELRAAQLAHRLLARIAR